MDGRSCLSPSDVSTPFGRRFTNEHKRSLDETRAVYGVVTSKHRLSAWAKPDAIEQTSRAILEHIRTHVELPNYQPFLDALDTCQQELLAHEVQIFSLIDIDLSQPITLRAHMELNALLRDRQFFFEHEQAVCALLDAAFLDTACTLAGSLPPCVPSALTVPITTALSDPAEAIEALLFVYLRSEHSQAHIFGTVANTLYRNICRVSKVDPDAEPTKPLIYPTSAQMRPTELAEAYLGNTPLRALFEIPFPFAIPQEQRFAGHWIIAPPGRGKTTLLHAMVNDDLRRDAAVILMDSKGDLIEPFRQMKSIADRLIIIDPDPERPIAINPLDIPKTQIGKAVELLEYLFASLLEFELTATQSLLFRNVIRFVVTQFRSPTLQLFQEIMAEGWKPKYAGPVGRLEPRLKDFFHKDFDNENYRARRREVLQRLQLLLDNDAMNAILSSAFTRFTFDEALDSGKVIIIDNSKEKLGDQGAEFFGRFFIAQLLATAQRRSGRPQHQKKPVFCYIDECQNVVSRDEKIPTILDECRSQRIALILAHQRTAQITSEDVLSALQNCAIRFANSDAEARKLSHSLRTSEQFLENLDRGEFAAYIRDHTKTAITVGVMKPRFSANDRLSATEWRELRDRMARDYGRLSETSSSQRPPPPPPVIYAPPPKGEPAAETNLPSPDSEPFDIRVMKRFNAAPKLVQEILQSPKTEQYLRSLGDAHKLDSHHYTLFESEVVLAFLGMTPADQLTDNLKRKLPLSDSATRRLGKELALFVEHAWEQAKTYSPADGKKASGGSTEPRSESTAPRDQPSEPQASVPGGDADPGEPSDTW